jgi:phosphoglycerate kinase
MFLKLKNYRLHTWQLHKNNIIIVRVDCNVPSQQGAILDDSRLRIFMPTLNKLLNTGAQVILLTHWGRPKEYDSSLSTQHLIPWFIQQGIHALYIDSPCSLTYTEYNEKYRLFICENIRFLDDCTAEKWVSCLQKLGTHFVHDGFSVMHRNDIFNTQLPYLFPYENRSLGIAAATEIDRLDRFMQTVLHKPALGIFGGTKLENKIDAILQLSTHHLTSITLLPLMCMPFFKKTASSTVDTNNFKKIVNTHTIDLILPTDLLVAQNQSYQPPYRSVLIPHIELHQQVITIGPETERVIRDQIDRANTIIINGLTGFLTIPESLEPALRLLQYIIHTKKPCLLLGGDTYAIIQKHALTQHFPFYSLAGGAALDYCSGKELPGLLALE